MVDRGDARRGIGAVVERRCPPRGAVDDLVGSLLANSQGSLAAYKDLYRAALDSDPVAGLAYEAEASYPIADTDERVADFR